MEEVRRVFGLNKPKEEKQEQKRPDDWVSLVEERLNQSRDWEKKRQWWRSEFLIGEPMAGLEPNQ